MARLFVGKSAKNLRLNQHIFKVTPKDGFPIEYVYRQLSAYIKPFAKMAEAHKTTMGHITADHLAQSRVVIPNRDVLSKFGQATQAPFDAIVTLRREIRELTLQRDTLLPLLMNGQVEVA